MSRKFSQKLTRVIAIVCMVAGVFCLLGIDSANTAIFSGTQQWSISASGWNAVCEVNVATGGWFCNSFRFGNNRVSYGLPFGAWKAFYLWDDSLLRWDELVWVYDQNL